VPVELLQGTKQAGSEGQSESLKVNGHYLWCKEENNNNNNSNNNNNNNDDDNDDDDEDDDNNNNNNSSNNDNNDDSNNNNNTNAFRAPDELGTCMTSLISPKQSVLLWCKEESV